jgi:hypothetical protein
MKKILLAALATTAVAGVAHAGTINLDLRGDMNGSNFSDEANRPDYYKYYIQTGRLDYKNQLNDETGFRLRWRFAGKDQTTVTKRDSTNQTLDFAYVTQKLGTNLLLTIGKFGADIGAYEGAANGADLYFLSEAYGGTSYIKPPTGEDSLTGFGTELYYTGAKLSFQFADQEINIQTANSDTAVGRNVAAANNGDMNDVTSGSSQFAQNKTLSALVYKGAFIDKMLGVMASYHYENLSEEKKANYLAAGVQFKSESWLASLEYMLNTYDDQVATVDVTDKLESWVANFRYTFGDSWTPLVKVVASKETIDNGPTNKFLDFGVALEYKPAKDSIYRYHVAYNNRTLDSDKDSIDGANLQEIILGVRIYSDFVK